MPPNKKSWSKDHATPDGKCSDDVLLEWLTEPGNFQRYRGIGGKSAKNKNTRDQKTRNSNGDTRDKVLTSIVARLHQHKLTHRTKHTVGCHLQEWVTKFNKAQDLVNRGTGGGGPTGEGSILNEEIDPNDSGDDTNNAQDSITDIKGMLLYIKVNNKLMFFLYVTFNSN